MPRGTVQTLMQIRRSGNRGNSVRLRRGVNPLTLYFRIPLVSVEVKSETQNAIPEVMFYTAIYFYHKK